MTIAKRRENFGASTRIINVNGLDIEITQPGFEVSLENWNSFNKIITDVFKSDKAKSRALRILINGVNLGFINLMELDKKIEKEAEKTKEVIYL